LCLTAGCDAFQYLKMKRDKEALRARMFEVVNFVNMVSQRSRRVAVGSGYFPSLQTGATIMMMRTQEVTT